MKERWRGLAFEPLERRALLSVTAVAADAHHVVAPYASGGSGGPCGPVGYSPAEIRAAYGFNRVALDGAGTTIAIVDAYDNPNIAADLRQFDCGVRAS